MNLFHLFSFIPVLVFALIIWYERIIRQGHNKRNNTLFYSAVTLALSGIVQMSFFVFRGPLKYAHFQTGALAMTTYFVSILLLEYSIHSKRIDQSFLTDDFMDNLRSLKIPAILMGATVLLSYVLIPAAFSREYLWGLLAKILPGGGRSEAIEIYSSAISSLAVLFFVGLIWNLYLIITQLFNLLEGVIRRRKYPFLLQGMLGVVYFVYFIVLSGSTRGIPFWPFFLLNAVYFVRILEEFYFWNSFHVRSELSRQGERIHSNNLLLKKVTTSPEEQDKYIVLETVNAYLEKALTRLVISEYKFTGAAIYRLSTGSTGKKLKVDHVDQIIGFCTPLREINNIKNMSKEKINDQIMNLTFDLQKIKQTPEENLKSWGDKLVKKLIRANGDIVVETTLPKCYLGMQRLVCLAPIMDMGELTGMMVLFKDSFDRVYPGEREVLLELGESLSVIYSIMSGKEVQRERTRLQGEMETAKNIQTSILPKKVDIPGYDIAATMETATEVGGDVYDYIPTDFGNYLGIGDVAGHGLPSGIMALIQMSALHGAVETTKITGQALPIDKIYDVVNRVLCTVNRDRIGSDKFMTQNYFLEKDGRFFHSGTHEIALLYRGSDRTVEELNGLTDKTGFLGLSEYVIAEQSVGDFTLNSGDILVLYTDGVIEAKDQHSEQFGLENVKKILIQNASESSETIIESMKTAVKEFAKKGDIQTHKGHLADDFTMLVFKRD